ALLGYFAAGLTFIGPLVCWLIKKDTSRYVDYHGKEALNFQINILVYAFACIAVLIATCGLGFVIAVPALIGMGIYNIIMPIIAGVNANSGQYYRYPAIFRLIK